MLSLNGFEKELKKSKEKRIYPRDINFSFEDNGKTLRAELTGKLDKKDFRRFDPWTLACLSEMHEKCGSKVSKIDFIVNKGKTTDKQFKLNFEALRRRLSFLSLNNNIQLCLKVGEYNVDSCKEVSLYDKKSLFHRPDNELIHSKISKRSDDNEPNLLEKAFQAFLYGKGLKTRTNDRLAILGEDFYKMKGKEVGILREFPTGVFEDKISDSTRILPTEYVDIVTLNKWGNLSVIELKLDNPELEVISQILDYGIYFACYRKQIAAMPDVVNVFNSGNLKRLQNSGIFCYVVNNRFHPRFNDILKFYSIKNKNYGFTLKKVILGETTEI